MGYIMIHDIIMTEVTPGIAGTTMPDTDKDIEKDITENTNLTGPEDIGKLKEYG